MNFTSLAALVCKRLFLHVQYMYSFKFSSLIEVYHIFKFSRFQVFKFYGSVLLQSKIHIFVHLCSTCILDVVNIDSHIKMKSSPFPFKVLANITTKPNCLKQQRKT